MNMREKFRCKSIGRNSINRYINSCVDEIMVIQKNLYISELTRFASTVLPVERRRSCFWHNFYPPGMSSVSLARSVRDSSDLEMKYLQVNFAVLIMLCHVG